MASKDLSNNSEDSPPALACALRRLLRPLFKLLIAHQITHPWFSNFIKSIYVDVAINDFQVDDKIPNDSRVTFLTGVHRKDVRRIRLEENEDDNPIPKSIHLGGLIVSRWCAGPEYLNDSGHPIPLPRLTQKDGSPSFESLVASISKDIRARAVLDEWQRLGMISVSDKDFIQLHTEAFIPEKGFEEKAYYFGQNLESHIAACVHNMNGEKPAMMERSVYYDGLSAEDIEELEQTAKQISMEGLQTVNRLAVKLRKKTAKKSIKTGKMNFGVYFYHAPESFMEEKANKKVSKGSKSMKGS
jgi:hypothetical protein